VRNVDAIGQKGGRRKSFSAGLYALAASIFLGAALTASIFLGAALAASIFLGAALTFFAAPREGAEPEAAAAPPIGRPGI
jgi:Kef-type K+ transport system membrane component KefB